MTLLVRDVGDNKRGLLLWMFHYNGARAPRNRTSSLMPDEVKSHLRRNDQKSQQSTRRNLTMFQRQKDVDFIGGADADRTREDRLPTPVVRLECLAIEVGTVSTEPLVIACAADRQYALPLAVMLRSVVANLDSRRTLKVYIVDSGLDPGTRSRISASLPERVTLHWIPPERTGFVDLPLSGRMTIAAYDKLTIGRWLPKSEGRALWLDCDLLALADLARLWETVQGRSGVLATQDTLVPTLGARFGVACHQELGIDADAEYFNSGIMLIDVARWRSDDIAARALTYLRRYRRWVYFWDQEALNAALVGKWTKLDPRWNWSPRFDRIAFNDTGFGGAEKSPWIVHFSGSLKPWHFEGKSAPYELYYQYLDSTAWAGSRPARTWRNMALRHYESSRFRNMLSPLETLAMVVERAVTLRYVSADPNANGHHEGRTICR